MPRSYQVEIKIKDDPEFYCNALAFATRDEASAYGAYKLWSWSQAEKYRVVESDKLVNYEFKNDTLRRLGD